MCPVGWLSEVVSALRATVGEFEELTVEVNPDDVTREYALGLRGIGVNRVSMGVQSFSDTSLMWMARRHSASRACEAYKVLREAGFDNVSLDLIFGYDPARWGSSPTAADVLMRFWREDLEEMLRLRPEHISAYQMGVEDGSVLGEKALAGLYHEPADEICAAQYALLQKLLSDAGYEQYEVSNFALPGRRALHNSGYWERLPYIGLGPETAVGVGTFLMWISMSGTGFRRLYRVWSIAVLLRPVIVPLIFMQSPVARHLRTRMCWWRK